MFCLELVRFWPPPGRHDRSSENLQMLLNYKVLLSLLIAPELSLLINLTVNVKVEERLLNHDLCLNFQEIQSYLNLSKDVDALRNSKSVGECTSNSCVSQEREDLLFDPDMEEIIRKIYCDNLQRFAQKIQI